MSASGATPPEAAALVPATVRAIRGPHAAGARRRRLSLAERLGRNASVSNISCRLWRPRRAALPPPLEMRVRRLSLWDALSLLPIGSRRWESLAVARGESNGVACLPASRRPWRSCPPRRQRQPRRLRPVPPPRRPPATTSCCAPTPITEDHRHSHHRRRRCRGAGGRAHAQGRPAGLRPGPAHDKSARPRPGH